MSILLEALRKSEKNQQSYEVPDIHTDDQTSSVSEPLPMGPLAILLVVAFFASGWFVWNQYQPPAGSLQQPVILTADNVHAVSEPVAAEKKGAQSVASSPSPGESSNTLSNPSVPTSTEPTSTMQASTAQASAGQSRTPVESYQPLAGNNSPPEPGKSGPASGDQKNSATGTPVVNSPGSDLSSSAGSSVLTAGKGVTDKSAGAAEKQFHPGEPAPISYWELPDAVRSDVPEIKFSVLVYATDPADRFVLINGQRLGQGDSIQPGLEVKEIRRDGVVFSYRLYQFLVER